MSEHIVTSKNEMVTFVLANGDKFRMQITFADEISIVKVGDNDDRISIVPETTNRITLI